MYPDTFGRDSVPEPQGALDRWRKAATHGDRRQDAQPEAPGVAGRHAGGGHARSTVLKVGRRPLRAAQCRKPGRLLDRERGCE